MLKIESRPTRVRVLVGSATAAVISLSVMAIATACGWKGERPEVVVNFACNITLILWLAWAFRKQLVKGAAIYLLLFYVLAGMLAFSAAGLASTMPFIPDAFGTEIDLLIDECKPAGSQYICTSTTTESFSRTGKGTLAEFHQHGDIVHGTYYGAPFMGFAEGSHAPPRPALLPSFLSATALLVVIAGVLRALVKAVRAPRGSPIWEPEDSLFVKPRSEAVFRWLGLLGGGIATAVSGYLFMAQLAAREGETVAVLTLSVGDWMTVASVMVGLVAWGYRKAETPFGKKIVAASSKVTLVGLLCVGAIFAVLQSEAVARQFIMATWTSVWDAIHYVDRLQGGFTTPMLLASAALLLTAHLMTLQLSETDAAIKQRTESLSVFASETQQLIDFLGPHANGYKRVLLDREFPCAGAVLVRLHAIGLVVQINKRPRLTPKGRCAVSTKS